MSLALFDITNSSNRTFTLFAVCLLCSLFLSHFALSVIIVPLLYSNGFMILFIFKVSFISLIFLIGWCLVIFLFIDDDDNGDEANPVFPLKFVLFFVSGGNWSFERNDNAMEHCFTRINRQFSCCKIINYFITILLLLLSICFSPLYSISAIMTKNDENFSFWIYYQLLLIIPNTIIQIIIICLTITSIPNIIITLCMISVIIGIAYSVIIIFLFFELLYSPSNAFPMIYQYSIALMINIEMLSVLNIIFIACFMDLWNADFNQIQYVLLLICFINIFYPNLPFYKSYLMYYYFNILNKHEIIRSIINDKESSTKMDKMFCILLSVLKTNNSSRDIEESDLLLNTSNVTTLQQVIMEQYKYSKLTVKEKKELLSANFKSSSENCKILKNIACITYIISSIISFTSPIIWVMWITVDKQIVNIHKLVFVWCVTGCYILFVLGLGIFIKRNKMGTSWEGIKYLLILTDFQYSRVTEREMNVYHNRQPIIKILLDELPYDIGMIIILYLFEQ